MATPKGAGAQEAASALTHVGCGGAILELRDAGAYPYELENGKIEMHAALVCDRCGAEIIGDSEIVAPDEVTPEPALGWFGGASE